MSEPYVFRLNILTQETKICLERDAFQVLEVGKPSRTYRYDQVSRVRLSYEPSRATADLYLCRIFVKGQSTPVVTVSSTFFRGFMSFDPQLPAYRNFVLSLHDRLHAIPAVTYRAGVSNLAYWGNAVFLTVVVVFAAMLLIPIAADVTMTGLVWLKVALIAFAAPLAAAWFWANRPRDYNPAAISTQLLPNADAK